MMGEPDFFNFGFRTAVWIGIAWDNDNEGFELIFLLPFIQFGFYVSKEARPK